MSNQKTYLACLLNGAMVVGEDETILVQSEGAYYYVPSNFKCGKDYVDIDDNSDLLQTLGIETVQIYPTPLPPKFRKAVTCTVTSANSNVTSNIQSTTPMPLSPIESASSRTKWARSNKKKKKF